MKVKTYSELIQIPSYIERYRYLKLGGKAGEITFGNERYLNQILYKSPEWKSFRREMILRDEGYDLGVSGYSITGVPILHHMNPITIEQIEESASEIFDPEYLICCSYQTHNAIHYGDQSLLPQLPVVRRPNDTCLWK